MLDLDFTFLDVTTLTSEQTRARRAARVARSARARAGWYKEMDASGLDEEAAKTAANKAAGPR